MVGWGAHVIYSRGVKSSYAWSVQQRGTWRLGTRLPCGGKKKNSARRPEVFEFGPLWASLAYRGGRTEGSGLSLTWRGLTSCFFRVFDWSRKIGFPGLLRIHFPSPFSHGSFYPTLRAFCRGIWVCAPERNDVGLSSCVCIKWTNFHLAVPTEVCVQMCLLRFEIVLHPCFPLSQCICCFVSALPCWSSGSFSFRFLGPGFMVTMWQSLVFAERRCSWIRMKFEVTEDYAIQ